MASFPRVLFTPVSFTGIKDSNVDPTDVSFKGGFFSCPDEAMDHRYRRKRLLEGGQRMRKGTDQRRSAIRAGPAGSDNAQYVTRGVPAGPAVGVRADVLCRPSAAVPCPGAVEGGPTPPAVCGNRVLFPYGERRL